MPGPDGRGGPAAGRRRWRRDAGAGAHRAVDSPRARSSVDLGVGDAAQVGVDARLGRDARRTRAGRPSARARTRTRPRSGMRVLRAAADVAEAQALGGQRPRRGVEAVPGRAQPAVGVALGGVGPQADAAGDQQRERERARSARRRRSRPRARRSPRARRAEERWAAWSRTCQAAVAVAPPNRLLERGLDAARDDDHRALRRSASGGR